MSADMLMGVDLEVKCILKTLALLLALIAATALIPSNGTAQKATKKLTVQDVIDLLTGDVPSDQVAQEAEKAGISFQVTPSVAKQIRDAGGTDDLIRVLRSLCSPRSRGARDPPRARRRPPRRRRCRLSRALAIARCTLTTNQWDQPASRVI